VIWRLRHFIFSTINASRIAGILCFDRLRIDDRIGWMHEFTLATSALLGKGIEGLLPDTAPVEPTEMVVDGISRREILGQHPPLNTALDLA
jgi:hypothetical protein